MQKQPASKVHIGLAADLPQEPGAVLIIVPKREVQK